MSYPAWLPGADPVVAHAAAVEQVGAVIAVSLVGWVYLTGVGRLWARTGAGRGIERWRVGVFGVGLLAIPVALAGPVPVAAERWFSLHMVQHQLLMMLAAPLLVVGRPGLAMLWAVPANQRRRLSRWRRSWKPRLTSHWVAVAAMVLMLWAWHVPQLYDAAVVNPLLHAAEHATLFWASVAFWAAVAVQRRSDLGRSVLALFAAGIATSMLAVILLFAGAPLYPHYVEAAARLGSSALDDQRIAALIMWIPSGMVGLAATWVLFNRWLGSVDTTEPPLTVRVSP